MLIGIGEEGITKGFEVLRADFKPCGHFVPAVRIEVILAGAQRMGQMKTGDRSPASLPLAFIQSDHDRGTMKAIDQPGRDDADHAGVPAFASQHDGPAIDGIQSKLARLGERLFPERLGEGL